LGDIRSVFAVALDRRSVSTSTMQTSMSFGRSRSRCGSVKGQPECRQASAGSRHQDKADGEIRTPGQRFTKRLLGAFEGLHGHALNSTRASATPSDALRHPPVPTGCGYGCGYAAQRTRVPQGLAAAPVFKFVPCDSGGVRGHPQRIQNSAFTGGFRPPEFGSDRAIRCRLGCQSAQG
jgi:hypothetical protein